jgi:hypothetical protein
VAQILLTLESLVAPIAQLVEQLICKLFPR